MAIRGTRIVAWIALALVALLAAAMTFGGADLLRIASGSTSRALCGATFISGFDPERVYASEILTQPGVDMLAPAMRYTVDRPRGEVRTRIAGLFATRAGVRPGLGCVLAPMDGVVPDALGIVREANASSRWEGIAAMAAPTGDGHAIVVYANPDIARALEEAFDEPDPQRLRRTLAIVVMYDGKLVAERYAPGVRTDTPLWAHSLTKSLMSAAVGVLVREGRLRIDEPVPLAAWRTPGDAHAAITIDGLLRMDSGLPFDETGSPLNSANRMWFLSPDMTAYAASVPPVAPPATRWAYSNLGYMVLGRIVRDASGGTAASATRFLRRELFDPLGMRTALVETDATGTPVGAGSAYASARDWARFGQLYLDDGVVDGRRILPAGWVAYSASRTLKSGYGAGFWTNLPTPGDVAEWGGAPWGMTELPQDMFYARGALGQFVVVIPSKRLVVARFGTTLQGGTGIGATIAKIIAALPAE